ncbi:WhiB family transcriptional regulator [Agromyces sp. NPDC058104]|uniref:WhiB family transcriptional regulator n=1 Tax=Agromyces sp. NPDC058104 TaxID=3346342 RepID=UPI0036DCF42B
MANPRAPRLRTRPSDVADEFVAALRENDSSETPRNCLGREATYALYRNAPGPDVARALCEGCPLLELCDAVAKVTKPAWGVWGGIAYYQGAPHYTYTDAAA